MIEQTFHNKEAHEKEVGMEFHSTASAQTSSAKTEMKIVQILKIFFLAVSERQIEWKTNTHSLLCYGKYILLSIIELCYNSKFLFTKNNILDIIICYISPSSHKKIQTQRTNSKIYGTFLGNFSVF